MARWNKGEELYDKLISNLAEYVSEQCENFTLRESGNNKVIEFAKVSVFDFVNELKVEDMALIHEYFMFIRTRKDPRWPVYTYNGGDRAIAVTRYIQNNIELELSKQYA